MIVVITFEMDYLKEYRKILKDHKRMEEEIPDNMDIAPILLKKEKRHSAGGR